MAHKKGLGSSRNGRDSNAKRLGVKVFAGQAVTGGEIIVRQRGTKFKPGDGVGIGKDDTIYATRAGKVEFKVGRRGRVIRRGDQIQLVAISSGFTVSTLAVADQDGAPGDRICVRTEHRTAPFIGQVLPDGRVALPGFN